jgi:hypothetical protein
MLDIPDDPHNIHGARGQDGAWMPAPSVDEANAGYVPEAPRDTLIYGRRGSDGTWQPVEGGAVWIGPNPPDPATVGMLWWRDDPDGTLYILYDDGTSEQWVPASPGSGNGAGLKEAPLDGNIYARQSGAWVPSAFASQFFYAQRITMPGNEVVNTTTPFASITVPPSALPRRLCRWVVGQGLGAFVVSNFGLTLPIGGLNATASFSGFVENGFNSGAWVAAGGVTISGLAAATYEAIIRNSAPQIVGGRIFTYDPAVHTSGFRVGIGMTGGTNAGYAPTDIIFGIEGQIVSLG